MRIRPEQLSALDAKSEDRFREELLEHLARYAPELHELRGETAFQQVIDRAFEAAGRYGFTTRGPVRFFAEAMTSYGTGFHRDPLLPAVRERCADLVDQPPADSADELVQADRIFVDLEAHRVAAYGADDGLRMAALGRAPAAFRALGALEPTATAQSVAGILHEAHPERTPAAEVPELELLVDRARLEAAKHGLSTWPAAGVIAGLQFVFGSEVASDPLYPFVAEGLARADAQDPDLHGLGRHAVTYLEAARAALAS